MVKEYIDRLTTFLDQVRPKLPRGKKVEIKPFFGGAAGYLDGRIFISLTKVGLGIKLPEEARTELFERGSAKELRYFPKAPRKKQYALLSKKYLDNPKQAAVWVKKSIDFVASPEN